MMPHSYLPEIAPMNQCQDETMPIRFTPLLFGASFTFTPNNLQRRRNGRCAFGDPHQRCTVHSIDLAVAEVKKSHCSKKAFFLPHLERE